MPYTASMGADQPGLFVFVLDQSGSMSDPWPMKPGNIKADVVVSAVNNTLYEIGLRCTKGAGQVSPRCEIALLGYQGDRVDSAWQGKLQGREAVPVTEIVSSPLRIETFQDEVETKSGGTRMDEWEQPIWIEPAANGGTPMKVALAKAHQIVREWVSNHQDSFPPVVIHVTDGEPTPQGSDPLPEAEAIRQERTRDGNALLINIHVPDEHPMKVLFPANRNELPPTLRSAELMFNMSSEFPEVWAQKAAEEKLNVRPGSRMLILNADPIDAIKFIQFASLKVVER